MRSLMVVSGTEKEPVEDITLRDLKICFEGGGTAEHAARTGIQEYLDYSVIYPDIFSIPGRFPSAGPFLRHIRGLRIENCDFYTYEKDARPMLFAADVQDAVIKDVRVSGCEGGLTQIDSDIRVKDCDFGVKYLEGAGLRLYREGQEVSREVDAYFDTTASMVDRAEKGTVLTTIPADRWEKSGDTWKSSFTAHGAKLLYLNFYGNMELFVNGVKCASHSLPRFYTERMKWACDIADAVKDGENNILIRWEDPNDVGGLTSLLPFGAFTPLPVGLVAPAVILAEQEGA